MGAAGFWLGSVINSPTLGLIAGTDNVYVAQAVLLGQLEPAAVVRLAEVADCPANGTVITSDKPIGCRADSEMSDAVAAVPVLVVTCPVMEAGAVFIPL